MADDDRPETRLVTADTGRPPISGADRQRAYRLSRATKSIDVAGRTHELLKQLCDRDGIGIDAAVRSALEAALGQRRADHDTLEAAWDYVEAAQASYATFLKTDVLTQRDADAVTAAVKVFDRVASKPEALSPQTRRRVRWLTDRGKEWVNLVDFNSKPVEPLAGDARHGTVGTTAQTLLAGGAGIGLNNASLVLMPATDDEPGEPIVRVRVPVSNSR